MNRKDLEQFIAQTNFTASIFGSKEYDINNLTQSDVDELCAKINSQLSPENLSCDGELSTRQIQAKFKVLAGSLSQLHKMGFTVSVEEY